MLHTHIYPMFVVDEGIALAIKLLPVCCGSFKPKSWSACLSHFFIQTKVELLITSYSYYQVHLYYSSLLNTVYPEMCLIPYG